MPSSSEPLLPTLSAVCIANCCHHLLQSQAHLQVDLQLALSHVAPLLQLLRPHRARPPRAHAHVVQPRISVPASGPGASSRLTSRTCLVALSWRPAACLPQERHVARRPPEPSGSNGRISPAAALRARRRGRAVTPPHTVTLHEWTVGQRPSVVPGGVLSPSPTGAPAGSTPIP